MTRQPKALRSSVYQHVLQRAVEACGGVPLMAEVLGVTNREVERWMSGAARVPPEVFLLAVDCIVDGRPDIGARGGDASGPATKRLFLLPVVRNLARDALREALALHRAELGNVQLVNPEGALEIAAQSGFEEEFLQFFRRVSPEHSSACGAALKGQKQVIVDDVRIDPIFSGTKAAEVMLRAGARSVQSTPIIAASGTMYGMISTHFGTVGAASGLPSLEPICRRLADMLDQLPAIRWRAG